MESESKTPGGTHHAERGGTQDRQLSEREEAFLDDCMERIYAIVERGEEPDAAEFLAGMEHLGDEVARLIQTVRRTAAVGHESSPRDAPRGAPNLPGYEIISAIGRGGMGAVYEARQISLGGRRVALKVLPGSWSESARERFRAEARAVAKLNHPNVVAIYDVIEQRDESQSAAIAMELVEGASLAEIIRRLEQTSAKSGTTSARGVMEEVRFRLSAPRWAEGGATGPASAATYTVFVCRVGIAVARALEAVHAAGLIHRDVKPSNILLRRDGTPLLSDFGLVKAVAPAASASADEQTLHTETGHFLGTAAYAAPEQLRGEHDKVDAKSDVYSLGATLFHALTLRAMPVRHASEALRRFERGLPLPPLRRIDAKLPRDLETIVSKATEIDPARRYQSAAELADDLERVLELRPIRARAIGPIGRAWRAARRNRRTLSAAAAAVLLTLLLVGACVVWWVVLPRQADRHIRAAQLALLDPDYADRIYREVWAMGPNPDALRPASQILDEALREYALAGRWRPLAPAARLEAETVALARAILTDEQSADAARAPHATPADLRSRGLLAFLLRDTRTSLEVWSQLDLALSPDPFVEASMGEVLLATRRPARAYPLLANAARNFGDSANLWSYVADAAADLGDIDDAQRTLDRARALGLSGGFDRFAAGARVQATIDAERGRLARLAGDDATADDYDQKARDFYEYVRAKRQMPNARAAYAAFLESRGEWKLSLTVRAGTIEQRPTAAVFRDDFREAMERWWGTLDKKARWREVGRAFTDPWFAEMLRLYVKCLPLPDGSAGSGMGSSDEETSETSAPPTPLTRPAPSTQPAPPTPAAPTSPEELTPTPSSGSGFPKSADTPAAPPASPTDAESPPKEGSSRAENPEFNAQTTSSSVPTPVFSARNPISSVPTPSFTAPHREISAQTWNFTARNSHFSAQTWISHTHLPHSRPETPSSHGRTSISRPQTSRIPGRDRISRPAIQGITPPQSVFRLVCAALQPARAEAPPVGTDSPAQPPEAQPPLATLAADFFAALEILEQRAPLAPDSPAPFLMRASLAEIAQRMEVRNMKHWKQLESLAAWVRASEAGRFEAASDRTNSAMTRSWCHLLSNRATWIVRILTATIVFFTVPARAQCELTYDAGLGTLPEAQGFTYRLFLQTGPPFPAPRIVGDQLAQGPTTDYGAEIWHRYFTDNADFVAGGASVDLDLLVIRSTHEYRTDQRRWGYMVYFGDRSARMFFLNFGETEVVLTNDTVMLDGPNAITVPMNTRDRYHHYRVEVANGYATLLIDGVAHPVTCPVGGSLSGIGFAPNFCEFGDATSSAWSDTRLRRITFRAHAGPRWEFIPTSGISGRWGGGMAYDQIHSRLVTFGGFNAANIGETYELIASTWQSAPSVGPAPRRNVQLAYDAPRQRMITFGGFTGTYPQDTWAWNGTDWTQVITTPQPSERDAYGLAYDARRDRVVLFGGGGPTGGASNETWEFNGATNAWIHRMPTSSPPARLTCSLAYDADRARVVLFGGVESYSPFRLLGDTWEWDGTNWEQKLSSPAPQARAGHALAYCGARGTIVLFGGVMDSSGTNFADTWEWDGAAWSQVTSAAPSGRRNMFAASDPTTGEAVIFGGYGVTDLAEVWRFTGPPRLLAHPESNSTCLNGRTTLSITASGTAPFTYAWRHNGSPIPGATAATLTLSNVSASDGGAYDCIVTNACGSVTSNAATLTVTPRCVADFDDGTGTGTPDCGVTIEDLLYYLRIFDDGLIAADVDDGSGTGTPDGGVTIEDLLYYLARFDVGC